MVYKTYIVARDYGFAPNPFGKFCTLACCKQRIRKSLHIDDWVFGTGSKRLNDTGKLVFAMKVTEKVLYQDYWEDSRFGFKKPIMNGSLVQMYGDNIYHKNINSGGWLQENSHHSYKDGQINEYNMERDLSGKYVLISEHFYYFGKSAVKIPNRFISEVCTTTQGHKNIKSLIAVEFIDWLSSNFQLGRHDVPLLFGGSFQRYNGID